MARCFALCSIAIVAACSRDPDVSPRVTVRDSAGVRIVENTGAADVPPTWSISPEPVFRVGWDEDAIQFQSIGSGHIGMGDRVRVADRGTRLIHTFSTAGEQIATLGGPGEGPGEFLRIGAVFGLGGDSILISDIGTRRASVFSGGDLVLDEPMAYLSDAIYEPRGRTDDGVFVLMPGAIGMRPDQEAGWKRFAILATRDFKHTDTISSLPLRQFSEPGNMNPLVHHGQTVVAGGQIAHATSDRPEVAWLDTAGGTTQIARWDATPERAGEEHWSRYERGARERRGSTSDPTRFERSLEDARRDFGGTLPLFSLMYGDRAGNVWLGRYDIALGRISVYRVVSATGEWLGTVRFPRGIQILDITDDLVLGVERDAFDVQAVVLYRIHKPDR